MAVGKPKISTEQRILNEGSALKMGITLGQVVDTNDPQQMGRIRVMCEVWGDTPSTPVNSLPWAMYCSPFGGTMTCATRGPDPAKSVTEGPVSYGMWAIPKVGSYAFVMCLDGHPDQRLWIGCLPGPFLTHTLPMGRFFSEGTEGPFSSTEKTVEPIATNLREAFGDITEKYEGRTRGAEQQVAAVNERQLNKTVSKAADEFTPQRRGYQLNRIRPDIQFQATGGNYDSQMYSITTPGLHMLLMDDSDTNGKIRLRSTSGNQIILDDTNERIYVSTSDGKNWVEMDKNGNVDIYSERRISVYAEKDINFKAGNSFRVEAPNIHFNASSDFRVHSNDVYFRTDNDFNVRASNDINLCGLNETKIETSSTLHLNSADTRISGGIINIDSLTTVQFGLLSGTTTLELQVVSSYGARATIPSVVVKSDLLPVVYDNANAVGTTPTGTTDSTQQTPPAPVITSIVSADSACSETFKFAYAPNKVPQHEPYGRVMVNSNFSDVDTAPNSSTTLELTYSDSKVGKYELGETIIRNSNWRR